MLIIISVERKKKKKKKKERKKDAGSKSSQNYSALCSIVVPAVPSPLDRQARSNETRLQKQRKSVENPYKRVARWLDRSLASAARCLKITSS